MLKSYDFDFIIDSSFDPQSIILFFYRGIFWFFCSFYFGVERVF